MGLKFLKDLGLTTDDPTPSNAPEPTPARSPRPTAATPTYTPIPIPSVASVTGIPTGTVDQDIVNTLNDSVSKSANTSYDAFVEIYNSMQGLPDVTRIPMALNATSAAKHIPQQEVITSLDEKLKILDREASDYENAFNQSVAQEVTTRQQQMDSITQTIEQKKQEIQKLEEQRVQISGEMNQAQGELTTQHATFNTSLDFVRKGLTAQRDAIANILKSVPTNG